MRPLLAVALSFTFLAACAPPDDSDAPDASPAARPAEETVPAGPVVIHLEIEGMTCKSCVNAVTRWLEAVPGVQEVEVDLEAGTATVTASPETPKEALVKAVRGGYVAKLAEVDDTH